MRKILLVLLTLGIGGSLFWLTLRNVGDLSREWPKGLAETSLYQGQILRLRQALADYEIENGPWTTADGKLIAETLLGANLHQRVYLDGTAMRLDPSGRLMDPWNRPFRFETKEGHMTVVEERGIPGK